MDRNVYRFGQHQLDASRRRLTRGGLAVTLPARQFDLLNFFVANPQRILSVPAIMEAVWADVAVEPNNVVQGVRGLRRALRDDGCHIETVPRQGYQLATTVEQQQSTASHLAV